MSFDVLYKLKIAALLHDPPHKPFVLGRHEAEARELIKRLFGNEVSALIRDNRVRLADKVASSFDRWILSILMGEEWIPGLFKCEIVKIKNIVAPFLEKEIPKEMYTCKKKLYDEYIVELKNILITLDEWKLKYHLLYLFYEPLWIIKSLPWAPADTRIPTHSVFDHNYAVAAIINWTFQDPEHVKGLLVGLDVPGVQDFIASSRKVRDAWISSYLVSALTWYAVIELIDKLGPDILLTPSPRMNVFYLYWLKEKLVDSQGLGNLGKHLREIEELFYISDRVLEMYKGLGIPPYPIIPGRVTLILPSKELLKNLLGIEDLKNYFIERFRKGWKLLWKTAKKLAEHRVQTKGGENDLLWSFIKRVFEYYDNVLGNTGFDENPPLSLRVEYVEVNADGNDEDLWLLYDSKYRELTSKLSLAKYVRNRPETKLELYDVTKQSFEKEPLGIPKPSSRGFDYCTSCGKLPAIIILPDEKPEENEYGFLIYCTVKKKLHICNGGSKGKNEYIKLMEEFKDWLNKYKGQLEGFKPIFSPGEKLCPWCFLKRVLSLEPRILKILLIGGDESKIDKLINEIIKETEKGRTWFPSLSHISSTRLYEKITNLELDNFRKLIMEELPKLIIRYKPTPIRTWTWHFMKRIHDKIYEKIRNLNVAEEYKDLVQDLVKILIQSDPEDLWFNPDKRSSWNRILRELSLSKWYWRYYTLVRADGDSIGDLLEGKLTAFLTGKVDRHVYDKILLGERIEEEKKIEDFLHKYIVNSCECVFKEFMGFCLSVIRGEIEPDAIEENKEKWALKIARESKIDIDEARKRIDRVIELLRKVVKVPRIIISPTYHVSISGALMRIAMLDIAIISELDGVVTYACGDDLMAFVPVDRALEVVYDTRRSFAGTFTNARLKASNVNIDLGEGFLQINNSYLPLLPSIGRSYCIYIAHYHHPLSVAIIRSLKLLDQAKERFTLSCIDYKHMSLEKAKKDMLIVAYNPRVAREEYTVLPLTWRRPIISENTKGNNSKVACLLTFVDKLLRLVDERFSVGEQVRLSHNLLYDAKEIYYIKSLAMLVQEAEEDITRVDKALELSRRIIQELIKRNIKPGFKVRDLSGELLQLFEDSMPFLSLLRRENEEKTKINPVFLNAIDVVRLIRNGMR